MYADLVCKGGGILGIALVGAICYFEDMGYKWQRIAGTSVGAIVGALSAVGYSGNEINKIMWDLDFKALADKNTLQSIPIIGPISSLFLLKGIHSGDYIENFLREKFEEKGKTIFKDISENNESKLKVIAADVTKGQLLILPDDLIKYNIDPLEYDIAKAVRMSLSIPLYFTPVTLYDLNNNPSYIVDGGLLSNLPVWIFDSKNAPRWPTFGLNLINHNDEPQSNNNSFISYLNNNSFISYLSDIVFTSLATNEDVFFRESDFIRIINIPTSVKSVVDFDISNEKKLELYNAGYDAAKLFLKYWSFHNYKKRYRS